MRNDKGHICIENSFIRNKEFHKSSASQLTCDGIGFKASRLLNGLYIQRGIFKWMQWLNHPLGFVVFIIIIVIVTGFE